MLFLALPIKLIEKIADVLDIEAYRLFSERNDTLLPLSRSAVEATGYTISSTLSALSGLEGKICLALGKFGPECLGKRYQVPLRFHLKAFSAQPGKHLFPSFGSICSQALKTFLVQPRKHF
jgi:hypothetical protein